MKKTKCIHDNGRAGKMFIIDSQPGDGTRYRFSVYMDGPDEGIFATTQNTFRYPGRINFWDVRELTCALSCVDKASETNCNPHTFFECVETLKELREEFYGQTTNAL